MIQKRLKSWLVVFIFAGLSQAYAQSNWEPSNGPYGGGINTMVVNDQGEVFAGTYSGVYRTANNGQSWERVSQGMSPSYVISLALSANGDLYAGIGAGLGDIDFPIEPSLFRSEDNAKSWTKIESSSFPDYHPFELAINQNGDLFWGTDSDGIYRSTDGGISWVQINNGFSDLDIVAISFNSNGDAFVGTSQNIYRSEDNGDNWESITNSISGSPHDLVVNQQSGDIFVSSDVSVYRSSDNGSTWANIGGDSTSCGDVSLKISTEGTILVSGCSLYLSSDNGNSWNVIFDLSPEVLAFSSGGIFAAFSEGGGSFISLDEGKTWNISKQGLQSTHAIAIGVNTNDDIYTLSWDGIFRSADDGDSWQLVSEDGSDDFGNVLAFNSQGHIFQSNAGILRSIDNGSTWERTTNGIPDMSDVTTITSSNSGELFVGLSIYFSSQMEHSVFRSNDNGESWFASGNGIPLSSRISAIHAVENGSIFASAEDTNGVAHIYRSSDSGENWSDSGIGQLAAGASFISSNTESHVFLATDEGFYRSTDNGENWQPINTGLPSPDLPALAIHAATNGYLYASILNTEQGGTIYRSVDNGNTWSQLIASLPTVAVLSIASNSKGRVFAGGFAGGVFRTTEVTSVGEEIKLIPGKFSLHQNYPNPFNPSTTIQYDLPNSARVSLAIYTLLGEKVRTLVAGQQPAGAHTVQWDGRDEAGAQVASGVYFYQISAQDASGSQQLNQSRKLLLLR